VTVETSLIDAAAGHELFDNPQNPDRSLQDSGFSQILRTLIGPKPPTVATGTVISIIS
jgi:hypothetical protein